MTIQKEYNPEVCSETLRIEKIREDITDKASIDETITKETSIRTTLHQDVLADGTVIADAVANKDTTFMQEYAEKKLLRATIEMKYRQPTNIRRVAGEPVPTPTPTPTVPTITISGAKTIKVGQTGVKLTTNVTGATVTWTSSNAAVLEISADGTLTPVKAGSATITASAEGYKNGTYSVTVSLNTFTVSGPAEVTVGQVITLTPSISDVIWTTSSAATATVNEGTVTGVKVGTVKITASKTGYADVVKTITVKAAAGSIKVYQGCWVTDSEDVWQACDDQDRAALDPFITADAVKTITPKTVETVAGNYNFSGVSNDDQTSITIFAYPASAATITKVTSTLGDLNSWYSKAITIDGVVYTVWYSTDMLNGSGILEFVQ